MTTVVTLITMIIYRSGLRGNRLSNTTCLTLRGLQSTVGVAIVVNNHI